MKKSKQKSQKNRVIIPVIIFSAILLTGLFVYQQYITYRRGVTIDGISAPVNGSKELSTGWRRFRLFYDTEFSEAYRKNIRVNVPFEHTVSYVSDYDIYSAIYKKERPELNIEEDPVLKDFFSGYSRKKVLTIERTGKQLEKNTYYTIRITSSGFNIFNYILGPKEYIYTFSTGTSEEDENISRTAKLMSSLGSFAATYQSKENKENELLYFKKCPITRINSGYDLEKRDYIEKTVLVIGDTNFIVFDVLCDTKSSPTETVEIVLEGEEKGKTEFENFLSANNIDRNNIDVRYKLKSTLTGDEVNSYKELREALNGK
jgi:hypothetical protein